MDSNANHENERRPPAATVGATVTNRLLANNESYAAGFSAPPTPQPAVAVVACMDARLDVFAALGLAEGEAQVIRNAGGAVTDDVIRSLAVCERVLGTSEIMLIHHTDCGMLRITDDAFRAAIQADTGIRPPWAAETFTDLDDDVRQSMARIKVSPFLTSTEAVRGFVFDVGTGRLREVHNREPVPGSRF